VRCPLWTVPPRLVYQLYEHTDGKVIRFGRTLAIAGVAIYRSGRFRARFGLKKG